MSERWRKVPGWPYEASSLGRIRRQDNAVTLTPEEDGDGYLRVTLADGRRRRKFGVHQLVALAWHGPPEVLHGPGGQQDNSPQNLRYGSRRDNERDKRSLRVNGQEKKAEEGIRTGVSRPGKGVTGVTEGMRDV